MHGSMDDEVCSCPDHFLRFLWALSNPVYLWGRPHKIKREKAVRLRETTIYIRKKAATRTTQSIKNHIDHK